MRFPIFAKAIHKCDKVLKPHGIDIIDIITNKDKKIFDNILNSFVGIAAIQVWKVSNIFFLETDMPNYQSLVDKLTINSMFGSDRSRWFINKRGYQAG